MSSSEPDLVEQEADEEHSNWALIDFLRLNWPLMELLKRKRPNRKTHKRKTTDDATALTVEPPTPPPLTPEEIITTYENSPPECYIIGPSSGKWVDNAKVLGAYLGFGEVEELRDGCLLLTLQTSLDSSVESTLLLAVRLALLFAHRHCILLLTREIPSHMGDIFDKAVAGHDNSAP